MAALDPSGGFGSTLSLNEFMREKAKDLTWYAQKAAIDAGTGGKLAPLSPAYLKRKAQGRTKGGAKGGVPAILFDSGNTLAGIQAVAVGSRDLTIELRVPELLQWHIEGAGRLPVRNPFKGDVLERWQQQFAADLEAFLSGVVRSWKREGSVSTVRVLA